MFSWILFIPIINNIQQRQIDVIYYNYINFLMRMLLIHFYYNSNKKWSIWIYFIFVLLIWLGIFKYLYGNNYCLLKCWFTRLCHHLSNNLMHNVILWFHTNQKYISYYSLKFISSQMFIKYEMSWFKVVYKHSDMFPENLISMCVWSSAKILTYWSNRGLLNFILIIILYEYYEYFSF